MSAMGRHVALQTDRPGVVSWLTPDRRRAIYGLVAAVLSLGVAIGWVSQEQAAVWQRLVEQLAAIAALLLAVLHTGGTYTGPISLPDQPGEREG